MRARHPALLRRSLMTGVLLMVAARVCAAQLAPGTWSARSNTGLVVMGTYTAQVDSATGAITGGWTLLDTSGKERARGGWSAAKAARAWSGSWRAVAVGDPREWAGTFTADLRTTPTAPFRELFAQALTAVIRGTWRTGPYNGTWAVKAAPPP